MSSSYAVNNNDNSIRQGRHDWRMQRSVFDVSAEEAAAATQSRGEIDRLRNLARGAHRNGYSGGTGPLDARTWSELLALGTAGKRRHVQEYIAGCRTFARRRLLAKGDAIEILAERVHRLVVGSGYRVDVAGIDANRDWPNKPTTASSLAAGIAGASWGSGATAQRELSRRHRSDIFLH